MCNAVLMHSKPLPHGSNALQRLPATTALRSRPAAKTISACNSGSGALPALKEWAPVVSALAAGDQSVLLRKGGIKEGVFTPQSPAFLLFPTAFHTDAALLKPDAQAKYAAECAFDPKEKPQLVFNCIAEVTGAWKSMDPAVLAALDPMHVYGPKFLAARLRWRPKQALTVMEVRCYRLSNAVVVDQQDDFWGCFSWVDVPCGGTISIAELLKEATPVLGEAEAAQRQELTRQRLTTLSGLEAIEF